MSDFVTIQTPDGREVRFPKGMSRQDMAAALNSLPPVDQESPKPNVNPGVNPAAPENMVLNPQTGQYTSRELLANAYSGALRGAGAAAIGAGQGASLGSSDEIFGGVNALVPGKGTMGERYAFGREASRAQLDSARASSPIAAYGGEILGAGATALAYGLPAMANRGLGGAMDAGGGVGAAEGAAYGLMSGEGGLGERARSAGQGAAIGAGAGVAFPAATALARSGVRAVGDAVGGGVGSVVNRGSQGRANRALASTLNRSGQTADDVANSLAAAARDGQSSYSVADALGVSGQRRLSGIARAGGDASAEITDYLTQRQLDQPDRVGAIVGDAFGFSGNGSPVGAGVVPSGAQRQTVDTVFRNPPPTARQTQDALRGVRSSTASAQYNAAREAASPVDVRGVLNTIDDRISGMAGSDIAGDSIDGKFAQLRGRLAAGAESLPDGTTARELSDFDRVLGVKQDVDDMIGAATRAGRNNEARELMRVKSALDEALEASSDGYRVANDTYRDTSRVIDAVDQGADMTRRNVRFSDAVNDINGMTATQRDAARLGYGDRALSQIEGTGSFGTNRAANFTRTKAQEEAQALAINPDLFKRQIGREMDMHGTFSRALTGSRTADNVADIADLQPYDVNLLMNLIRGNFSTAGQQAAQSLSNAATGMNSQTRQILAQALMSKDASALQSAIQQAQTSDARKQIVDAILRVGAQPTEGYGLAAQ